MNKSAKTQQQTDLPDFVKAQLTVIDSLNAQLQQLANDFNIEKACKNQAYFFILENGLFDQYREYVSRNPVKY